MNVSGLIPEQPKEIKKINPGDYQKDGIWYCGKCHQAKQRMITVMGSELKVWMLCDCDAEELKAKERKAEYEEKMAKIQQMKVASMMPGKFQSAKFREFQVNRYNEKAFRVAQKYAEKFEEMEERNQGLLFSGPVGTGKSHTAACIANALMEREIPVIMTSFVKILQENSRSDEKFISLLDSARLLIIDDLGAERDTDYAQERVYNIIDSRVRANKPMILTTNLRAADMLRTEDVRYQRIYDRIFEVCYPVEVNGPSFRIQEAATRQEAMNRYFNIAT